MTHRNDTEIRRTENGSIDYAFYDRRARRIRGTEVSGMISRIFGSSKIR